MEIEAIVAQIKTCIGDPAYDGLTFGVISLLGSAQAKQIEKALLDSILPEQWKTRDLRCGDSADFQGSERDVMFLSMVAAHEAERRYMPLTHQMYLQRYNVAASRARDQMWGLSFDQPCRAREHGGSPLSTARLLLCNGQPFDADRYPVYKLGVRRR